MNKGGDEDWLEAHRDGRLGGRADPLGQALRNSYTADNHDTLDSDVTGLMIDLSKVPYEPEALRPAPPMPMPTPTPTPLPTASGIRPSILARIGDLLGWR